MQASTYPVNLEIEYPDRLGRGTVLLKVFFGWIYVGIPHGIALIFLFIAAGIVTFIAFFAILFTGKYPRGMFDFVVGVQRWSLRVSAYFALFRDEYPPFSLSASGYPITYEVEYPDSLSRGILLLKLFFAGLYLWIPHGIALQVLTLIQSVVTFFAFFAILFTGSYPRGLFDFSQGVFRWSARVYAYAFYMRDEYPPFRLSR